MVRVDDSAPRLPCSKMHGATTNERPAPAAVSNRRLFAWMVGLARPARGYIGASILWLVLWSITETLTIRQAGEVVNVIQGIERSPAAVDGFWAWIGADDPITRALRHGFGVFALLIAAYGVLRYLRIVADAKTSMHVVFHIRAAVYDKLQRVGFAFHDRLSTGQLINRALADLQHVRAFLQTAILLSLEIVLGVAFSIVLIATRNVWVALASLAPLPLWILYIVRFSRRIQPVAKEVMEADDKNVSIITENIAGAQVVRAFAAERAEEAKYAANLGPFKERVLRRIRMFADFNPTVRAIALASHISLFTVGALLMLRGLMAAGDLLILGGAMALVLQRLQGVATINEQYQSAIVSARRLHEVLFAEATVEDRPDAPPLVRGPGSFTFQNVTFGFDPERPILHDVSFEVPPGAVVAIVGPTGSGKSALVSLIGRYYDPQQGRVLLDGQDLRHVSLGSLRREVGVVFQETYLFSDSIAANIAYGRPELGDEDIARAAERAQAAEFIDRLPAGYDTVLTERGGSLSGGQRQRLSIARALATDPRVLVLDDATAAIDPKTEEQLRAALRSAMKGRTTFVIAHRISTVRSADLVLVLERGRIVQSGTHAELVAHEGPYRALLESQLQPEEGPAT